MSAGPRAIVFDFDGVIADDEPLHLAAFQRALASDGITITREQYYARYLGFDDRAAIVQAFRDVGREPSPVRLRELLWILPGLVYLAARGIRPLAAQADDSTGRRPQTAAAKKPA